MGPLLITLGILLGIILLILVLMYNGFVSRRNRLRNAFATIDVQLKKRWDLVPQLVETVRAYASHEKGVFERVTRARRGIEAVESDSPERFRYEQDLGAGLSRVMMLAEDYPELKAGEQFLNLQRNLTEVESQIAAARRAFNATVTEWNEGVEMFPGSVMAGICGFRVQDWFETPESQRKVTDVQI
ncbi:MAG: LemA family protein [Roseibacillus sp.]|jgi:LemA protein|nr:LemA family protein [Roseibacillus sp.]MBP34761.1 LemA family protein [Roseibacillus sp.]MCP4729776.1 LemA family protein [Roseibacillus sp.]MDP6209218.1 LemA family protein [Roseibacillus sp.]MDP7307547.1 LemA family protein [Roseibacillus sp.]|tara:strand:+ start:11394 stop:11951 length:558 start_codon:yes stop_codon:yes gene_type:complete